MKKLILGMMVVVMLVGCGSSQDDTTPPVVTLKQSRVQVAINSQLDYLSYVKSVTDEEDGNLIDQLQYQSIDTSVKGQYSIEYSVKDQAGNEATKSLLVDVVEFFEDGIFNPKDVEAEVVKNPTDVTVLVNKIHSIPDGWIPDDLESVVDNQNLKLRREANEAYTQFYQAAKAKGIDVYSISAYRSNATQSLYWNNQVKVNGVAYASKYSAYPGRSEHQLGLAIDVSYTTVGDRLSESVADQAIGKFIVSDAHRYGFILRYPQDKIAITNYGYEPWHMRYVGVALATQLYNEKMTLEEYYGAKE